MYPPFWYPFTGTSPPWCKSHHIPLPTTLTTTLGVRRLFHYRIQCPIYVFKLYCYLSSGCMTYWLLYQVILWSVWQSSSGRKTWSANSPTTTHGSFTVVATPLAHHSDLQRKAGPSLIGVSCVCVCMSPRSIEVETAETIIIARPPPVVGQAARGLPHQHP